MEKITLKICCPDCHRKRFKEGLDKTIEIQEINLECEMCGKKVD